MQPRINLNQEELFPVQRDWLDAFKAFWAVVVAVSLFAVGSAILWYQDYRLFNEVKILRAQEQSLKGRLSEMMFQPAKTAEDEKQIKQLAEMEADIKIKKLVLELLSGQRIGNRQGFSKHFIKLAGKPFPELWLTQIHIMDGGRGVIFVGRSLKAGIVFDFVKNMTDEGVFEGRKFQFFQMKLVGASHARALPQIRFAFGDKLDVLLAAWQKDLTKEERSQKEAEGQRGVPDLLMNPDQSPMEMLNAVMGRAKEK